MPLGNVTYQTLNNAIASFIVSNCANIASFNNIPACFKSGYSLNRQYHRYEYVAKMGVYTSSIYENIDNNTAIPNKTGTTAATIVSLMRSSTVPADKYPDSEKISMPKFIAYFNNVCSFCLKYMGFVSSPHNGNVYLTYRDDNYFYTGAPTYDNKSDDLVYASSVNEAISMLSNRLNRILRHKSCKYYLVFDGG